MSCYWKPLTCIALIPRSFSLLNTHYTTIILMDIKKITYINHWLNLKLFSVDKVITHLLRSLLQFLLNQQRVKRYALGNYIISIAWKFGETSIFWWYIQHLWFKELVWWIWLVYDHFQSIANYEVLHVNIESCKELRLHPIEFFLHYLILWFHSLDMSRFI